MSSIPKRYALVGTGGRAVMYTDAIAGTYRQTAQLVGFCDVSPTRMAWHNRRLGEQFHAAPVPTYAPDDFGRMLAETRADAVIVTTVDGTHHHYIIAALEAGRDVICEKPMTIDAPRARAILDAVARTRRKLRVTFNYRYAPHVSRLKELMQQGVIGRPTAVDFSWVLDTSHGADYFRRWHREKDKSGGLLVHKATHHFDLVNWWIDSRPQRVFAMGELKFYGRRNAEARGDGALTTYDRYTGHPQAKTDPFALFLDGSASDGMYSASSLRGLYHEAEADSGYVRDRNVFADDISIEDTMAVTARYHNGVILNYSLVAYSPWEGYRVAITGTRGRVELYDRHGSHIIAGQSDEELARAQAVVEQRELRIFPMFGVPYDVPLEKSDGAHGGADPLLLADLFSPAPPPDPLHRVASHLDGAASILLGIAANESIRTGHPVNCDALLPLPTSNPPA